MDNSQTNLVDIITQTINTLFQNLFSSMDNGIYPILDDITFISSDIMHQSFLEKIIGTSSTNGILLIANSFVLGFILYYCIQYFLSVYTSQPLSRPYQFIFKLLLVLIFMNFSFFICEKILFLNSSFSLAIRNLGELLFHKNICFTKLISHINSMITIGDNSFNLFSLDGLIKSLSSIGLFNLVFSYSLRYIMIEVFILLSPFAFLSLCLSSTSWFFKTWLRTFLSLLLMQVFISFILLIIFSFEFNSDLFSKFIYIGSIYALIRANSYMKELVGGISTDVQTNFSSIQRLIGGNL